MYEVALFDAFTDTPFAGNPAGVVYLRHPLDAEGMQRIATEIGAPTTGFIGPRNGAVGYPLLFHTPTKAIDMCGHVTLASAWFLLRDAQRLTDAKEPVLLQTPAGPVSVHPDQEDNKATLWMRLDPPSVSEANIDHSDLAHALGLEKTSAQPFGHLSVANGGLRHLVVPLSAELELTDLRPNYAALAALNHALEVDATVVFPRDRSAGSKSFRCRDLCPAISNPEEAASGTSNAAVAAHMAAFGNLEGHENTPIALQSRQGVEMGRPSDLSILAHADAGALTDIWIGGVATRTLSGVIVRR